MSGLEGKKIDHPDGIPKRPKGVRSANGVSRAGKFRQIDVARALKAAQKAKLQIAAVRIEPDGTILVIPGIPEAVPSSERNPWDVAS